MLIFIIFIFSKKTIIVYIDLKFYKFVSTSHWIPKLLKYVFYQFICSEVLLNITTHNPPLLGFCHDGKNKFVFLPLALKNGAGKHRLFVTLVTYLRFIEMARIGDNKNSNTTAIEFVEKVEKPRR